MSIGTETAALGPPSRRRDVLNGEGMLRPTRRISWRGEVFDPARTRVAPDHPVASQFPDHFEPAYAKESGVEVLRFMEARAARRRRSAPIWPLGESEEADESWRLD